MQVVGSSCTHVPVHKLLEVGAPDVTHVGVLKQRHPALINLEALLPELVLLQQEYLIGKCFVYCTTTAYPF